MKMHKQVQDGKVIELSYKDKEDWWKVGIYEIPQGWEEEKKDNYKKEYGVNWSACGTVSTKEAKNYASAILEAVKLCEEYNK